MTAAILNRCPCPSSSTHSIVEPPLSAPHQASMAAIHLPRYEAVEDVLQVRDLYDPRTQWASFIVNALKVWSCKAP